MADDKNALSKLKRDLKAGTPARLYLFHGEESYLREHYLDMLRKVVVNDQMPEFNLIQFEGKIPVDALIEAIDSYPAMSEKKMVVVRDFDIFKADEAYRKQLESIFADLPEYVCLVFVYASLECKPDKRTKLYLSFTKHGEVISFQRAGRNDLISWVKRRFAALDREIDTPLAEYLIFYCGGLMQGLIPEIEKIGAYSKRKQVSRQDVDAVATPNPEAVVFDLTDAIASKRYREAMAIAEKLAALNQEPIQIVALIGRQFRQLYSANLILKQGQGTAELMKLWGMRSDYPAKLLLRTARQVDGQWVQLGIRLCMEADAALKLGGKSDVVEYLIARLAQDVGERAV